MEVAIIVNLRQKVLFDLPAHASSIRVGVFHQRESQCCRSPSIGKCFEDCDGYSQSLMIILESTYNHLTIILRSSYDHLTIILRSSYDHLLIIL